MANDNVFPMPPAETLTPALALLSALDLANANMLSDVLALAIDTDGDLVVRSSRMDRKTALWLVELARQYVLGATDD